MINIEVKLYSDSGINECIIFSNGIKILTTLETDDKLNLMKDSIKQKLHELVDSEVDKITNKDFIEY